MRKAKKLTLSEWRDVATLVREIDAKIGVLIDKTVPALGLKDADLIASLRQKHLLKVRSMLEDRMIGQVDPTYQDQEGRLLRFFFGQERAGEVAGASQ